MVKPKHDSQWRRAVLGLMKMRNDGMGDEAFNNAIDYMNNLYFAGEGAFTELLESVGCPHINGSDDQTTTKYGMITYRHIPDIYGDMVDTFGSDICEGDLEAALNTLDRSYRQEMPKAMVDELNELCKDTATTHDISRFRRLLKDFIIPTDAQ